MKKAFSIISKAPIFLVASLGLMILAWLLFFSNMRYSIQFTGGVEAVVKNTIDTNVVVPALTEALESKGYDDFSVEIGEKDGFDSVLVQIDIESDEKTTEVNQTVSTTLLETKTIESVENDILETVAIGPSIGTYIKKSAKNALLFGIILMAVYILFAFSGMRALISPTLLAGVTIVTMLFDVSVAAGAYGFLMWSNPVVQIDTIFIIALLTVLGYSVNDTIVIFDRIRENFIDKHVQVEKGQLTREEVFEMSLWQTMRRSLATSISTLIVVIAMYIFGTGILRMFAFTLGLGVIAGTYSSIFLAAPFAYLLSNKKKD